MSQNSDILIEAHNISKKFCLNLKRSLLYGAYDIGRAFGPTRNAADSSESVALRKDEFWAVRDINFELRRGECLGLLGHNGAGKSTLLKILNNLIKPDSGHIIMRGRVCALIELGAGFNPILTGRENIYNSAAMLGISAKEVNRKMDAIIDFSELEGFLDMPLQNYSSGMKVRLGFAVAMQMEPDVLLLDEVLAVGDVAFRHKCVNAMAKIMQSAAVIFVSHSMPQVTRICTKIHVMNRGRCTYLGSNIAEGVEHYTCLADKGEASISGSGEVTFEYIETEPGAESTNDFPEIALDRDQPFSLRLKIKVADTIRRIRMQVTVWSMDMVPVMNIVAPDGQPQVIEFRDGECEKELTIHFPALNLNCGRFAFSLNALSENLGMVYCRHDKFICARVAGHSTAAAGVLMLANWNQSPSSTN